MQLQLIAKYLKLTLNLPGGGVGNVVTATQSKQIMLQLY
jgi:hypothetical protein